jgi:AcrR family transcriptional regulator
VSNKSPLNKSAASNARPRGRPRSARARTAILAAARAILEEGGITALTMEGIAVRAGVGKPTIYREWPNAHAVAMAALMSAEEASPKISSSSSPLTELRRQLRAVAGVFALRMGRQAVIMIASASGETELSKSFRNHFILARREEGREIIARGIAQREVRDNIEVEVVLDMIYGPIFYRLLMGNGVLDEQFTDAVVEHALHGISAQPAAPRRVKKRQ